MARWLRTGVIENGKRIPAKQGTPQGAPISTVACQHLPVLRDGLLDQAMARA